jgi:hypothetical protein
MEADTIIMVAQLITYGPAVGQRIASLGRGSAVPLVGFTTDDREADASTSPHHPPLCRMWIHS